MAHRRNDKADMMTKPANGPAVAAAPDRAPMILWRTGAPEAAAVLAALEQRYALDLRDRLPKPGDLAASDAAVLLLYLSPARALARDLAAGTAPEPALQAWRAQTRALLQLNRQDRRRVQVLELGMALRHPGTFRARFDLPGDGSGAELAAAPAEDPVLLLLAQRLLLGEAETRALLAELGAVSVDLTGNAPPETEEAGLLQQAWQDLRDSREAAALAAAETGALRAEVEELNRGRAALQAELEMAQSASELLQAQNRAMQEELERLARRRTELETLAGEVPVLRQRAAEKAQSLAAADSLYRALEARAALLQEGQARLGDSNARLQGDLEQARQELEAGQARIAALEAEVGRFFTSRSYRLTAPLRRMRAVLRGRE